MTPAERVEALEPIVANLSITTIPITGARAAWKGIPAKRVAPSAIEVDVTLLVQESAWLLRVARAAVNHRERERALEGQPGMPPEGCATCGCEVCAAVDGREEER